MDNLLKIKKRQIEILQKYNGWGKDVEETGDLLSVLGENTGFGNLKDDSLTGFKTKILVDTNTIVSPVYLDYNAELPIVELFLDKDNFVVYTTKCIYTCKDTIIKKIEHKNIVDVDENSINDVFRNKQENLRFFDIMLITSSENRVSITIEYGISFRPIVYFLSTVNDNQI